jgi:hypothetical protein
MHDNTDGHRALTIDPAEGVISVNDGYDVAKPQLVKAILSVDFFVEELDVIIPGIRLVHT